MKLLVEMGLQIDLGGSGLFNSLDSRFKLI